MTGKCGLCVVVHTCNPSTWEVETEISGIQGHPSLCSESKASFTYMKHCLKKQRATHIGRIFAQYHVWSGMVLSQNQNFQQPATGQSLRIELSGALRGSTDLHTPSPQDLTFIAQRQ